MEKVVESRTRRDSKGSGDGRREEVVPNPKAKLLGRLKAVMRLKHYS